MTKQKPKPLTKKVTARVVKNRFGNYGIMICGWPMLIFSSQSKAINWLKKQK